MNANSKNRLIISCIAIIAAIVLMVAGYNRNEFQTYFAKAIQICTQCIGIG